MNKLSMFLSFCLIFLLFSSCAPDYTDDVEGAYDVANLGSGSCTTIDGYTWSPRSSYEMHWDDAVSYCDSRTACGYSDWHLPTISELRTLIQNCSQTETNGTCGVTDSCLSSSECRNDACSGCSSDSTGKYSKLGDTGYFWSSSTRSDFTDVAWFVGFPNGYVDDSSKADDGNYVRCVR